MPSGTLPPDVVIARTLRAHTRTLVAMCTMVVVLMLIGAGALSMAGGNAGDPRVVAGLTMLGAGQVLALAAAAFAGAGWLHIVRAVGTPGSTQSARAVADGIPVEQVQVTGRRLALLLRVTLGVAVLGVTAWAVIAVEGVIGAAVGAVLVAQVAVVITLVRTHLLLHPRRP
ncbi:hypothetical protein IM660_15825 [Ruania alkalisoli]|uniref:Uncharacterized protein n=1 Tax=Ruania alkalisoli TaxID=2779775 RepID=A0A7M1SRK6_9MICO|nr:hypothetical protein [Ruania alkalisoli]QOR70081.1 hypothetical protein IM660_15825 [Ruania alkalisoli]